MDIFAKMRRFVRGEPLSCEQVNRFILDYLERSLDDRTRVAFEAHLFQCANCKTFLDQYQSTLCEVKTSENIEIPKEVVERTLDFLRKHYDEKL